MIKRSLESITRRKSGFIDAYDLNYKVGDKDFVYEIVSLNNLDDMDNLGSTITAVELICRFEDGDYLVCKEFRYAFNDYVFEFPAGCLEEGEAIEAAARRELKEETGLDIVSIDRILPADCYALGVTDQKVVTVYATVAGEVRPSDNDIEDIICYKMGQKEIRSLLETPDLMITHGCLLYFDLLVNSEPYRN